MRLVSPPPPPPPGRAPVTPLTADLWPEVEPGPGEAPEDSWTQAVTAVTALSEHLITLLDAICPGTDHDPSTQVQVSRISVVGLSSLAKFSSSVAVSR